MIRVRFQLSSPRKRTQAKLQGDAILPGPRFAGVTGARDDGVRRGWRVKALKLWLPLGFFLVFTLFPFYWMAITSLKPNRSCTAAKIMPLIVHHPTLEHFVDLLTETSFLLWT